MIAIAIDDNRYVALRTRCKHILLPSGRMVNPFCGQSLVRASPIGATFSHDQKDCICSSGVQVTIWRRRMVYRWQARNFWKIGFAIMR
jgi:hypothetical protein